MQLKTRWTKRRSRSEQRSLALGGAPFDGSDTTPPEPGKKQSNFIRRTKAIGGGEGAAPRVDWLRRVASVAAKGEATVG